MLYTANGKEEKSFITDTTKALAGPQKIHGKATQYIPLLNSAQQAEKSHTRLKCWCFVLKVE